MKNKEQKQISLFQDPIKNSSDTVNVFGRAATEVIHIGQVTMSFNACINYFTHLGRVLPGTKRKCLNK